MEGEEQFLQAIAAGGEDRRLVYADWLDERGQRDKAEFVRAEVRQREATRQLREAQVRMDALKASLPPEWLSAIARPSEAFALVLLRVQTGTYQDEYQMEAYLLRNDEIWPALHDALMMNVSACLQYALTDEEEVYEHLRKPFRQEFERLLQEEPAIAESVGAPPFRWSPEDTERARRLRPLHLGSMPTDLARIEHASGLEISLPASSAISRVYHSVIDDVFLDHGSPDWVINARKGDSEDDDSEEDDSEDGDFYEV